MRELRRSGGRRLGLGLLALGASAALACSGGDTVFAGVGNSGNRVFSDELEEVSEKLAEWPDVPQVREDDLRQIYQSLLRRARNGDPTAAKIVLGLAELQREAREEN